MNKRLRSRVFAAAIASSTFVGLNSLYSRSAFAQDRPSAAEELARGSRLYDQKQFADAKKILLDVDPGQLPEDQRPKRAELLKNIDLELAKTQGASSAFDSAQAAMDSDKLADASAGFQGIIDDSAAAADVKEKAKIQLALVKEKQAAKAPQMKELLSQAQGLYDQGKLDEAQNALTTVIATGSDLGWQDNAKPQALQQKISDKRAAIAHENATPAPASVATVDTATAPVNPPADPMVTVAPSTGTTATPTTDVAPPTVVVTPAAPADEFSPLDERSRIDKINKDRTQTQYDLAMKASVDATTSTPPQYAVAVQRANEAVSIIDQNRALFSESEASAMHATAAKQVELATAQRSVWEGQQKSIAETESQHEQERLVAERAAAKKKRVDQLMKDADNFVKEQQYESAAELLRTIRVIDPQNSQAELMLTLVDQRIGDRIYEAYRKRATRDTMRHEVNNQEEIIPYADLLVYPEDWVNLTRNRVGDQSNEDTPANRAVRQRLDENLKDISADQTGFEKVINFLRENTGTNIIVNWTALGGAGIDRNTPVSVALHDVPFSKALNTILSEVGGGAANLGYTIDQGVITISTRDDLNSAKYQVIRVYDIRDMLVQPDDTFNPPALGLGQIQQSSGGGGSSLFQDNGGGAAGGAAGSKNKDAVVQQIIDRIKANVASDSWRDSGGTIGSIGEFNGQLIINQTVDNQTSVYNLLQQLRETRSLQISIEARFLLVQNDFLDDFGLGWGLTIPAGELGGNIGAITLANNTSSIATPQSTNVPNSLATTNTISGLSLTGSILDNWQLSILLRATQADKRTVNLTAPRVTLFNGQRGYLGVTQEVSYVSNFNQTVTAGSINSGGTTGTQLTVSQVNFGVQLDVTATASADRRYVVMNIHPNLVTLDGIDTFGSLPAANGNGGTIFGGVFIQLPRLSKTEVYTMVSIPDGGTLLVGGQKLVGESEIEAGVPILSKIPGLNRLFTNRSIVKDERTLLILVRPKIIIQKEIENALYGPGYDRPTGLPAAPQQGGQNYSGGNGISPGFSRGE